MKRAVLLLALLTPVEAVAAERCSRAIDALSRAATDMDKALKPYLACLNVSDWKGSCETEMQRSRAARKKLDLATAAMKKGCP